MTHHTVRDVMTAHVIAVAEETPFKDLAVLIAGRDVGAMPVLDPRGRIEGVVSGLDLLRKEEYQEDPGAQRLPRRRRHANRAKAAGLTAKDVMSSPAVTIGAEASVVDAARSLDRHQIRRLIVLGPEGRLAGLVSDRDLLKVYLRPDAEIRDEVSGAVLVGYFGANPALVDVRVCDGMVTLRTELERKSMIPDAVRMTRAVDGVVDVVNRLTFVADDTHLPLTADLTNY